MDRRTLLVTGGAVAAAGALAACGGLEAGEFLEGEEGGEGNEGREGGGKAQSAPSGPAATTVGDIPVGGGLIFPDAAIVVTQPQQGVVRAFSAICTHQGCLVGSVADNVITCPCHGAQYSAEDGAVLKGPAPEPLAPATVVVDGDSVVIG